MSKRLTSRVSFHISKTMMNAKGVWHHGLFRFSQAFQNWEKCLSAAPLDVINLCAFARSLRTTRLSFVSLWTPSAAHSKRGCCRPTALYLWANSPISFSLREKSVKTTGTTMRTPIVPAFGAVIYALPLLLKKLWIQTSGFAWATLINSKLF